MVLIQPIYRGLKLRASIRSRRKSHSTLSKAFAKSTFKMCPGSHLYWMLKSSSYAVTMLSIMQRPLMKIDWVTSTNSPMNFLN